MTFPRIVQYIFKMINFYFFSSMSLPNCRQDWRPMVISVNMSAIFFCISWFLAIGTPNWILVWKTMTPLELCLTISKNILGGRKIHFIELNYNLTMDTCAHVTWGYIWQTAETPTCRVCTVELYGNRTLQHQERPMQSHTEHCSSSQTDPKARKIRVLVS